MFEGAPDEVIARTAASELPSRLTIRELEVLGLTADGSTNNEIARRLSLSVSAVKFHLASIYRKLGVANRTEAAVYYLRASGPGASTGTDDRVGTA